MKRQNRLKEIINIYANGNQSEFARMLNVEQNVVANWLSRGFGELIINKIISAFPDINPTWLLTGEGSMLKSDNIKSNITPVEEGNYMMVEYVDLRASAGRLGGADVSQLPETHRRLVPREFDNGGFLIVRVDGDSMDDGTKRSLSDGDEVLIKEAYLYRLCLSVESTSTTHKDFSFLFPNPPQAVLKDLCI